MPSAQTFFLVFLAAAAVSTTATTTTSVVQCPDETTAGCSLPHWTPTWDMRTSTYTYCFGNCPLPWLANNTNLGVWGGVVGFDHYYTHQGMPCINGLPQEFPMQNNITIETKKTFPDARVLQYRITSGVPYDVVIHTAMVEHPDYFVQWPNGTRCEMWYPEHGTENQNCSWDIRASAYNWSNVDTQTWFLANVIQPVMEYADGMWLDGDGPDNGAWGCSGSYSYGSLPTPYPALDPTQIAAFCAGEANVTAQAQRMLIAQGGFDYNCFSFISDSGSLPGPNDTATQCANKIMNLNQRPSTVATVLYGDRTDSHGYTDETVAQAVAAFLLVRGEHWYFGFKSGSNTVNTTTAEYLLSTYGPPLTNMTTVSPNVFARAYTKMNVQLDCNTYTASFTPPPPV